MRPISSLWWEEDVRSGQCLGLAWVSKKAEPVWVRPETCVSEYNVRVLVQHGYAVVRVRTPVLPTLNHDRAPGFQTE